jgi:hypothetical protein
MLKGLGALLEKLDLAKYKEVFSANDVDFEMFLTLTEQDLKELGVSLGARRKMKLAISEIKQKTTTRSSSATVTQLLSAPARQAPWSSGRTNDLIPGLAAYPGPGLGAHLNPFGPMSAFADPQPFISPIAQAFNVSRPLSPQPYGQNLSTADNNCN